MLSFDTCRAILLKRLAEKPPGRIQLLVGPRQVGKTTLLLELEKKFKKRAFYIALEPLSKLMVRRLSGLFCQDNNVIQLHYCPIPTCVF